MALKSPVLKRWSLALVLQSLAFALERRELLSEKWLSRPLPLRSLALKAVALRTQVHTLKDLALAMRMASAPAVQSTYVLATCSCIMLRLGRSPTSTTESRESGSTRCRPASRTSTCSDGDASQLTVRPDAGLIDVCKQWHSRVYCGYALGIPSAAMVAVGWFSGAAEPTVPTAPNV